jgi:flagellar basal body-associated protein FliL
MKERRTKILIWILAIALVVALVYIGLIFWQSRQIQQMQQTLQTGYKQGITDTVGALYQQTENCQVTTINLGNLTKKVVDVACLQNTNQS